LTGITFPYSRAARSARILPPAPEQTAGRPIVREQIRQPARGRAESPERTLNSDSRSNCIFFNSSLAPAKGDVFCAVECWFRDVADFEGFVSVHKCHFHGPNVLGGKDAGLNNFGVDVEQPLNVCPTATMDAGTNPYKIQRHLAKNAVFMQVLPLPE
jgi:hypothetical protein